MTVPEDQYSRFISWLLKAKFAFNNCVHQTIFERVKDHRNVRWRAIC